MRHVVLGSDTLIGSTIVRTLISINEQNIIVASPTSSLPVGVPPDSVELKYADVLDPYSLSDLLEEDDIVYDATSIYDETTNLEDCILIHNSGFVNLLGLGKRAKVSKIITAVPEALGRKIPLNAKEETPQKNPSDYQKSLLKKIEIAQKYWNNENFGWPPISAQEMVDQLNDEETETDINTSKLENNLSDQQEDSEKQLDNDSQAEENSLNQGLPSLNSPVSLPSIQSPQSPISPITTPPKIETQIEDQKEEVKEENSENIYEVDEEDSNFKPELIVVRIGRIFGPFDMGLTREFCEGIRLERMVITGKLKKPISWINPIDAGRALIIMGNLDIPEMQYNIHSFIATPREILRELDKINLSSIKLDVKNMYLSILKIRICNLLSKIKLCRKRSTNQIRSLNTKQVFSDELARKTWEWIPRNDIMITAKEAMNWYINHVMP